MVNPIQLPVLLTQLPQLQKVQTALQSQPEAFQALAAKEVVEEQKKAQHQVPKSEKTEGSIQVGPDSKGDQGGSPGKKRQQRESEDEEQQEPMEEKAPGRIIDLKV
jgi:hypothetical protein